MKLVRKLSVAMLSGLVLPVVTSQCNALPATAVPAMHAQQPTSASTSPVMSTTSPTPVAITSLNSKDKKQMQSEQKQGADVAAAIEKEGKLSKDQAMVDRVNAIGQKIAAVANSETVPAQFGNNKIYPFTWTFHVVDDKEVNAFSLPGGFVYVNSGLVKMAGSDDELAGVLGHEITHAAHHHVAMMAHEAGHLNTELAIAMIAAALAHARGEDLGNLFEGASLTEQGIMANHYGEAAEEDADHGGVIYMQKAGYNPIAMLTFMNKLEDLQHRSVDINLGIFQDHPLSEKRVASITAELASMGIKPTPSQMSALSIKPGTFTVSTTGPDRQILWQSTVCATIHDPDGNRSAELLKSLNSAVANGLQFGDIGVTDDTVMINNQPWLKVATVDVAGQPGATPTSMANDIKHSIQLVLYMRAFPSFDSADSSGGGGPKKK